jgi:hypothetical protein
MSTHKRTFIVAVIENKDQFEEYKAKFLRLTGNWEQVLFVYNIGDPIDDAELPKELKNRILIVFNNDSDLLTKKNYNKDYLTATADATTVGTQLAGTQCSHFKIWNDYFAPRT